MDTAESNNSIRYESLDKNPESWKSIIKGKWVKQNTAILIIHGIGSQNPMETLDAFARGLAETMQEYGQLNIELTHELAKKVPNQDGRVWFENYIRIINMDDTSYYLDIYEYYWANLTEDKASLTDIQRWLGKTVDGAKAFYEKNKVLGKKLEDRSIFFNSSGEFRGWLYRLVLQGLGSGVMLASSLFQGILKLVSFIPFVGGLAAAILTSYKESKMYEVINVIADVPIYNTLDNKSKFYEIRQAILNRAIDAFRYFFEIDDSKDEQCARYDKVIMAGHSLGSQIAFDAINRLSQYISMGELKGYDQGGQCKVNKTHISTIVGGLVTFGSPLDKIAFFLRENIKDNEYLRLQMVYNYYCFKQRDWGGISNPRFLLPKRFKRIFDDILWKNYHDKKDFVSGSLQFYEKLTNVMCGFDKFFTHSEYWTCKPMYADIIDKFL